MNKPALYFTYDELANIKLVLSPELQQETGKMQGMVTYNIMKAAEKFCLTYGTEKMKEHDAANSVRLHRRQRKQRTRRVRNENFKEGKSKLPYSGEAQTGDFTERGIVPANEHTEILITHIRVEGSGLPD